MSIWLPWAVEPSEKYQRFEVEDAHDVLVVPAGLLTSSVAVTPPVAKLNEAAT
jgi:hypothetical protein